MSGLNQRFTKPPAGKTAREFESHILREYKLARHLATFLYSRRMSETPACLAVRFENRNDAGGE